MRLISIGRTRTPQKAPSKGMYLLIKQAGLEISDYISLSLSNSRKITFRILNEFYIPSKACFLPNQIFTNKIMQTNRGAPTLPQELQLSTFVIPHGYKTLHMVGEVLFSVEARIVIDKIKFQLTIYDPGTGAVEHQSNWVGQLFDLPPLTNEGYHLYCGLRFYELQNAIYEGFRKEFAKTGVPYDIAEEWINFAKQFDPQLQLSSMFSQPSSSSMSTFMPTFSAQNPIYTLPPPLLPPAMPGLGTQYAFRARVPLLFAPVVPELRAQYAFESHTPLFPPLAPEPVQYATSAKPQSNQYIDQSQTKPFLPSNATTKKRNRDDVDAAATDAKPQEEKSRASLPIKKRYRAT